MCSNVYIYSSYIQYLEGSAASLLELIKHNSADAKPFEKQLQNTQRILELLKAEPVHDGHSDSHSGSDSDSDSDRAESIDDNKVTSAPLETNNKVAAANSDSDYSSESDSSKSDEGEDVDSTMPPPPRFVKLYHKRVVRVQRNGTYMCGVINGHPRLVRTYWHFRINWDDGSHEWPRVQSVYNLLLRTKNEGRMQK